MAELGGEMTGEELRSQLEYIARLTSSNLGLQKEEMLEWAALQEINRVAQQLRELVYAAENNTGNEPSLSCFHRACDESKALLQEIDALEPLK